MGKPGYNTGGRRRLSVKEVCRMNGNIIGHDTDVRIARAGRKTHQDGYKLTAEKTYREYGINGLLLYAIRLNRQFGYTEENVLSWVEEIISPDDKEKLLKLNLQKKADKQQGEDRDGN